MNKNLLIAGVILMAACTPGSNRNLAVDDGGTPATVDSGSAPVAEEPAPESSVAADVDPDLVRPASPPQPTVEEEQDSVTTTTASSTTTVPPAQASVDESVADDVDAALAELDALLNELGTAMSEAEASLNQGEE